MHRRRLALALLLALAAAAAGAEDMAPALKTQIFAPDIVAGILGQRVFDTDGDEVGLLVDVLVDVSGRPKAGVVDVGGFLGVGTRRIALAWPLLHFVNDNGDMRITGDLSQDEAAAAPEYRGTEGMTIVVGRHAARP